MTACKVYGLYISDVLQQVDDVITLFAMEKELRIIKNRGPIPTTIPQGTKIENSKDVEKVLETVDREVVEMITAVRESKLSYEKEKAEAKSKEQQVRLARQTNKPDFNPLTVNSSTPIRNSNIGANHHQHTETTVHFDPNPVHHLYPTTDPTSHTGQYKPPARSEKEHLEEIFIRLKAAGLKLKLEKCFFKKHIQYLGHLISVEGIKPLPEKRESIAKMPAPKNPKEVKQFLGLVGYY